MIFRGVAVALGEDGSQRGELRFIGHIDPRCFAPPSRRSRGLVLWQAAQGFYFEAETADGPEGHDQAVAIGRGLCATANVLGRKSMVEITGAEFNADINRTRFGDVSIPAAGDAPGIVAWLPDRDAGNRHVAVAVLWEIPASTALETASHVGILQ